MPNVLIYRTSRSTAHPTARSGRQCSWRIAAASRQANRCSMLSTRANGTENSQPRRGGVGKTVCLLAGGPAYGSVADVRDLCTNPVYNTVGVLTSSHFHLDSLTYLHGSKPLLTLPSCVG